MNVEPAVAVCAVCSGEVAPYMQAWCNQCGALFHLNSRADLPGSDCGDVWIHEEFLSLEYACAACLAPPPAPAPEGLDDVLDLTEAAQAAGMTTSELEALAAAGTVVHRKTAGGILLFRRGDLAPAGNVRR